MLIFTSNPNIIGNGLTPAEICPSSDCYQCLLGILQGTNSCRHRKSTLRLSSVKLLFTLSNVCHFIGQILRITHSACHIWQQYLCRGRICLPSSQISPCWRWEESEITTHIFYPDYVAKSLDMESWRWSGGWIHQHWRRETNCSISPYHCSLR